MIGGKEGPLYNVESKRVKTQLTKINGPSVENKGPMRITANFSVYIGLEGKNAPSLFCL